MYTQKYQTMQGWSDVLSDILPAATQSAANIVSIFKPKTTSYSSGSLPVSYASSSAGLNLNSMLPWLIIGGLAVFAITQMRK